MKARELKAVIKSVSRYKKKDPPPVVATTENWPELVPVEKPKAYPVASQPASIGDAVQEVTETVQRVGVRRLRSKAKLFPVIDKLVADGRIKRGKINRKSVVIVNPALLEKEKENQ